MGKKTEKKKFSCDVVPEFDINDINLEECESFSVIDTSKNSKNNGSTQPIERDNFSIYRTNEIDEIVSDVLESLKENCRKFDSTVNRKSIDYDANKPFDPEDEIFGKSVGGRDTCFTIPRFAITMDVGPSIKYLKPEKNIFISHIDHDHITGFRDLICMSLKFGEPYEIFISEKASSHFKPIIDGIAQNEQIKINFHFVKNGDKIHINDNLLYEFFKVIHSETSIGISICQKNNFNGEWERVLTYSGDISLKYMRALDFIKETPQLLNTNTLIIECSSIASSKNLLKTEDHYHTNIEDINWLINYGENVKDFRLENLVLIHLLAYPRFKISTPSCSKFRQEIIDFFADNDLNLYYLTVCDEGSEISNDLMTPIQVIEKREIYRSQTVTPIDDSPFQKRVKEIKEDYMKRGDIITHGDACRLLSCTPSVQRLAEVSDKFTDIDFGVASAKLKEIEKLLFETRTRRNTNTKIGLALLHTHPFTKTLVDKMLIDYGGAPPTNIRTLKKLLELERDPNLLTMVPKYSDELERYNNADRDDLLLESVRNFIGVEIKNFDFESTNRIIGDLKTLTYNASITNKFIHCIGTAISIVHSISINDIPSLFSNYGNIKVKSLRKLVKIHNLYTKLNIVLEKLKFNKEHLAHSVLKGKTNSLLRKFVDITIAEQNPLVIIALAISLTHEGPFETISEILKDFGDVSLEAVEKFRYRIEEIEAKRFF